MERHDGHFLAIERAIRRHGPARGAGAFDLIAGRASGTLTPRAAAFATKVAEAPLGVRDDDVAALREEGWDESDVFELVVGAAAGAGARRRELGMRLLREVEGP